jgi:hypothetical protein
VCLAAVAALAVVLLATLARANLLGPAGVVMAAASVLLAGVYFLGFLLANLARYGWLCGSLLLCLCAHAAVRYAGPASVLTDTVAFLCGTALLLLLYLIALAGRVGQARYHR